jgi:hypothetical protein
MHQRGIGDTEMEKFFPEGKAVLSDPADKDRGALAGIRKSGLDLRGCRQPFDSGLHRHIPLIDGDARNKVERGPPGAHDELDEDGNNAADDLKRYSIPEVFNHGSTTPPATNKRPLASVSRRCKRPLFHALSSLPEPIYDTFFLTGARYYHSLGHSIAQNMKMNIIIFTAP